MDFYTVKDFRNTPKYVWNSLSSGGEVIITNNGKPTAIMVNITDKNFDATIQAIRSARD